MSIIPTSTKVIVLQNHPDEKGLDFSKGPNSTFVVKTQLLPRLEDGQILVKTIFVSNDAGPRNLIDKNIDAERLRDHLGMKPGDVMMAFGLGRVISSKSDIYAVGALVCGITYWQEYAIIPAAAAMPVNAIPNASPSIFLGTLGIGGLTAYFGITEVLKLQRNQTIVVSAAAGATGILVVQIAKHIIGAKVVAIAGTEEKCDWVKELGADIALNYKSPSFKEELKNATQGYVDAYFDNVGGEILDLMLLRVKKHGRIAVCGAVSIYNSSESTQLKNWMSVVTNRLVIKGFSVSDYMHRAAEGVTAISMAITEGKIDARSTEMIVQKKFEEIPETWGMLFKGGNTGKLVTQIAPL